MLGLSKSDQLFQILKERIEKMSDGDRFPSVREIMKEYSVSQFTVTPALTRLEEKKLVRCEVGKGTFVRKDGEQKPFTLYYYRPDWPDDSSIELELLAKKEAEARNYDYRCVVHDYRQDIYNELPIRDADAIFINPANADMVPSQLEKILNAPIPIIIKGTIPNIGINYVAGDNFRAGSMAAEYFWGQGHRNIAMLLSEPFGATSHQMLQTYTAFAERKGLNVKVIDCGTQHGEVSSLKAYDTLKKYLAANSLDFSAVYVTSDASSLGALKAFAEKDIAVPDDICVLGYGGCLSSTLFQPSLSSVSICREKLAAGYFEILDECLRTGKLQGHSKIVYPEIIERTSTILQQVNVT